MTPTDPPMPALDFASIRQQYPAAFAALIAWFCAGRYTVMGVPDVNAPTQEEYDYGPWLNVGPNLFEFGDYKYGYSLAIRELFDFFDQSGVYPHVRLPHDENGNWYAFVMVGRALHYLSESIYPTRTAAESAAFMAAFGKLEEMLNQEKSE